MRENELRIGNTVQFPSSIKYSVDILYKNYEGLNYWSPVILNNICFLDFEFQYKTDEKVFIKNDVRIECIDGKYLFNYYYGIRYLKYVHELQNLYFALTGKEL